MCCAVRVKGPPPHPIPHLGDTPRLADISSSSILHFPARDFARQGGRGREEAVRHQQGNLVFYPNCATNMIGPSAIYMDGWQMWWSWKVPVAVATKIFLASNSDHQKLCQDTEIYPMQGLT